MQIQNSFKTTEGKLYLVPTPIGNLEDMTFRAVRILKEVDLIASEDTRNTQKLLNHFEIKTKQISFHEHNTQERIGQLVEKMLTGLTIAQVSDAGMPSISDPGHDLVCAAIELGIPVIPLPGASAGMTALIASGLSPQPFYFYGFLPRKKNELVNELERLKLKTETLIFYESPHRVRNLLTQMQTVMGETRKIVLCREVTKKFEEFIRGTVEEALEWASDRELKGEFCILVEGSALSEEALATQDLLANLTIEEHLARLVEEGQSSKEAIKAVAKIRGLKKQDVYKIYHELE